MAALATTAIASSHITTLIQYADTRRNRRPRHHTTRARMPMITPTAYNTLRTSPDDRRPLIPSSTTTPTPQVPNTTLPAQAPPSQAITKTQAIMARLELRL